VPGSAQIPPMGLSRIRACDPGGVLAEVATAYGKTEAQVALNWLIGRSNVVAIPKSSTIAHASENCGASGWRLSQDTCSQLENKIHCRRRSRIESAVRRFARHAFQLAGRNL
jgi:diketogulonate reductase-like aldo/keto reductase